MIKQAVHEEELIHGMQRELQSHDKKQGMENLVKAADYLHSAMEIFEEAGLTAQADQVLTILAKIAHEKHQPMCRNCEEPMTKTEAGNYICIPCEGEKEYRGSHRKSDSHSVDENEAK